MDGLSEFNEADCYVYYDIISASMILFYMSLSRLHLILIMWLSLKDA